LIASADWLAGDDPKEFRILVVLRDDFGTLHDQPGLLDQSQIGRRVVLAEIHLSAKPFARPVGGFGTEAGQEDSAGAEASWQYAGTIPVAVSLTPMFDRRVGWDPGNAFGSFCVTLRSQPRDLALSRQPLISFDLACEALDVPDFGSGTASFNLPIAFGDACAGKGDAGRFAHTTYMGRAGPVFHPPAAPPFSLTHS